MEYKSVFKVNLTGLILHTDDSKVNNKTYKGWTDMLTADDDAADTTY